MVRGLVLHSISEAVELLSRRGPKLRVERVPLDASLGRIAASIVKSPEDIPPRDRSVLDGYAARWTDISGASPDSPVRLRLEGYSKVDKPWQGSLGPGGAVRVDTGSLVPEGADVVVPVEYTREVGGGEVEVIGAFPAGYGIAVRGEDLRKGETIIEMGDVITPPRLALLASVGIGEVEVYAPLRTVVYAVGDELVEPGRPRRTGGVYNSTARLVASWLKARGIRVEYRGILPDRRDKVREAIIEAISSGFDVVFLTGGTSVGERDATASAVKEVANDYVHGLALTPGRPGLVGVSGSTAILALSGMPVAAWSQLVAVFDAYYRGIMGRKKPWEPVILAPLARRYASAPGMTNVVRAVVKSGGAGVRIEPLRVTGSGILSTLLKANSYFIVPEERSGYDEGEIVEARLLCEVLG